MGLVPMAVKLGAWQILQVLRNNSCVGDANPVGHVALQLCWYKDPSSQILHCWVWSEYRSQTMQSDCAHPQVSFVSATIPKKQVLDIRGVVGEVAVVVGVVVAVVVTVDVAVVVMVDVKVVVAVEVMDVVVDEFKQYRPATPEPMPIFGYRQTGIHVLLYKYMLLLHDRQLRFPDGYKMQDAQEEI